MDDIVSRLIRELPDTDENRYDVAYRRGRAQARSSLLLAGLVTGFAGGVLAMFLFDPERGRSRRVELGQRVGAWSRDVGRAAEGRGKDLRNRASGAAHELGMAGTGRPDAARDAADPSRDVRATPPSVGSQLRRTDQEVDEASARVGAGAAALRADEERSVPAV